MTQIYLKHPKHGVKVAHLEMEAEFDETHGWTRYNPYEVEPEPEIGYTSDVKIVEKIAPPVNAMVLNKPTLKFRKDGS